MSFTTIDGIPQGERWEKQRREKIEEVKEAVKSQVRYDNEKVWSDHVKNLVKQGHLLDLAKCQNKDLTWKSFIFDLKKRDTKIHPEFNFRHFADECQPQILGQVRKR